MMRFTKEYELRAADFDCYDRLQPASVQIGRAALW